jgi:hypothetical protein
MIIIMWIRIGNAIDRTSGYLEAILIERAYGEPNILYVNVTEDEEQLLDLYVRNRKAALKIEHQIELISCEFGFQIHPITYKRCFKKTPSADFGYSDDRVLYYSKYRDLFFFPFEFITKDGKHFFVTKNE